MLFYFEALITEGLVRIFKGNPKNDLTEIQMMARE